VDWRDRFRAGVIDAATRARENPARGVVISDRDGNDEAYAWDVETGTLRRVSDSGIAVIEAAITDDGESIVYLRDTTGNEFGHLHRVPFEGGDAVDLTPDLAEYVAFEIRASGGTVTAIAGFADGQRLLVIRDGGSHVWDQEGTPLGVVLADDGSWIAIGEPMRGLIGRTVVRSLTDGSEIGRLDYSVPWAAHGRQLAVALHRDGWLRPGIWSPGEEPRELDVDIPGDVVPADWSDDGRTLLLFQQHRANGGLFLLDLESGAVEALGMPATGAPSPWNRPELHGTAATTVWSDARTPWSVIEAGRDGGRILVQASEHPDYPGAEWRDVEFASEDATPIQGWLITPDGAGPWPAIVYSHGGPTSVATPTFHPMNQTWVDGGYALLSVNYRGSTTFGDDYREALTGDVGGVDVADLVAGHRWLVETGVARPDLVIVSGYSWGGFLTLQCMATHPELWAGGIAGAPVADWILAGEDQNATLDAYDAALFGPDSPETRALKVRASPRTYVEAFSSPLLISTPEADSRTPLRPTQAFVDDMRAAGKDVTLHLLKGGHTGVGPEQWIELMESWIEFADRIVETRSARIGGA
jgi:dipeptidyl aminopeptidase/acylaminoacyl peptidase